MPEFRLLISTSVIILLSLITPALQAGTGQISGLVVDEISKEPIEYATVAVKKGNGELINGVITNSRGAFSVGKLPLDEYLTLEITFVSFIDFVRDSILLTASNSDWNTGTIQLSPDTEVLGEVEVTGRRAAVQTSLDKKVFSVERNIVNQSNSASDVLDNIPSVNVDINGNVSLRGNSNVRILIDGESSLMQSGDPGLILQQIPANTIEKVEVLTNPSSKYDPEGTAGIINIILKKEKNRGVNGTVSAGVGTWNKYNASSFVSYKNKKVGLTTNYSFRYWDSFGSGTESRENFISQNEAFLEREDDSDYDNMSHFGRIGLDIQVSETHSIGFSGFANYFRFNRDEDAYFSIFDRDENYTDSYLRTILFGGHGKVYNGGFTHRFSLPEDGGSLKTSLSYSRFRGDFDGGYREDSISVPDLEQQMFRYQQNTAVDAISNNADVKVDFEKTLSEDAYVDAGFDSELNFRRGDFMSESRTGLGLPFTPDTALNNDFKYYENTYAIYSNYRHSFGSFSIQGGVRLEYTTTNSNLVTTGEKFQNNYFSIYPSIYLSQKVGKEHELQLSYSRRVNRPDFRSVNPFRDYSDPKNLREGNPFLNPEYIHSFELTYNKVWEKVTVNSSLYYKMTTGMISRVTELIDPEENITLTTIENVDRSHDFGWELINRFQILDWWEVNTNFNLYRSIIRSNTGESELNNEAFSYEAGITSDMTVWKGLDIQLSGEYRGRRITPQGERIPTGNLDIALKKSILKEKGTIGVSVNDVFNTKRYGGFTEDDDYYQEFESRWESRVFFVNFSYGFGKMGAMFNKRANRRSNNGGGEPDEGGIF